MSIIKAEYIWIDGTEPTPLLRSKTKMLEANVIEKVLGAITGVAALPHWGFDGSSTNQATGDDSDCQLFPVFACRDDLGRGFPFGILALRHVGRRGERGHPVEIHILGRRRCGDQGKNGGEAEQSRHMAISRIKSPTICHRHRCSFMTTA